MTEKPKPADANTAVPKWVWGVFATLIVTALGCFAAAVILGGWMGPPRPTVGAFKPVEATEKPAAKHHPVILTDLPMMPTEVPAPAHVSAEIPPAVEVSPVAVAPAPVLPRWVKNAVGVEVPEGAPRLAIVIDDMGLAGVLSSEAVRDLPAGVTFSFLPYGAETGALALAAHTDGHEILIHMPMEPLPRTDGQEPDMGPHGLKVGMTNDAIEDNVVENIKGLKDLAVGVNNHMGSRFTAWPDGMRVVLSVLQREGLMFLDSKTIAPTAVRKASAGLDLPVMERDVFLDHVPEVAEVRAELAKAVELAKKRGFAVAIGHPLPATLEVLNADLPEIVSSGVVLVPLTDGLRK